MARFVGRLAPAEIALMKAMLCRGTFTNEQIAAHFNHPSRPVNQGRVSDAKTGKRWADIEPANDDELDRFLATWHDHSPTLAVATAALGPLHPSKLHALFPLDPIKPGYLAVEESSEVEFKLAFNWKARSKYAKSVAALANNVGGYLLFGIENATSKVVGIDEPFWDNLDPRNLSQVFGKLLAPSPDVTKAKLQLSGKAVGVLYVKEASLKPVVSTVSDADLVNGQIYFRYPGESCLGRAPEILAIFRERDRRIEERMTSIVQRIQQVGAAQAAIIDLNTGRVDGQIGHFLLPAELLSQVRVVQEGRLVDAEGAPALHIIGDLQVVGNSGSMVSVRKGDLSDEDVIEDFLRQQVVQNPEDYLRYLSHSDALWLPAYYYARLAKLSDPGAADLIAAGHKNNKKMVGRQIDRIRGHTLPKLAANLNQNAFADIRTKLATGNKITLDGDIAVQSFLKAAASLESGDVDFRSLMETLLQIFEEHYRSLSSYQMQLFRYATVRADLLFFSEPRWKHDKTPSKSPNPISSEENKPVGAIR